jgi:hypothetical protein
MILLYLITLVNIGNSEMKHFTEKWCFIQFCKADVTL